MKTKYDKSDGESQIEEIMRHLATIAERQLEETKKQNGVLEKQNSAIEKQTAALTKVTENQTKEIQNLNNNTRRNKNVPQTGGDDI